MMKRRTFLGTAAASLVAVETAQGQPAEDSERMRAGFARVDITPPLGTTMMGFGGRDMEHGCTGVHDPIYTRAAYLEHRGEAALIMGYDMCFLGREDADRFKGAIGRVMELAPRQTTLQDLAAHSLRHTPGAVHDLVAAIVAESRSGDSILVMSNGGFGGIHDRLLRALGAPR